MTRSFQGLKLAKRRQGSGSRHITDLPPAKTSSLFAVRAPYLLIALWVVTMIAIPILRWTLGDALLPPAVTASVLVQVAAVWAHLWRDWGDRQTLRVAALLAIMSWGVEWVGSTTGIPFGEYHYTSALQPQLGRVPVIVPLAWLMMLPAAWSVGVAITGKSSGWRFVMVSALAMAAWDLFLDPQMVAWDFWKWSQPGGYFGIPWINFAGWALSAAVLTWLAAPPAPPVRPLLAVYAIAWVLQTIGLFAFWQMPGPALWGFVGMGSFLLFSLYTRRRQVHWAVQNQCW